MTLRLALVCALLTLAPPASRGADVLPTDSPTRLARLFERTAAEGRFSGAVLVARGDSIVFSGAYGLADRDAQTPNTLDTGFNLGSADKIFTAVAIHQLIERGKLTYDTTVGEVVPDFPNADVKAKVRIRHLLSHTSGMGVMWSPEWEQKRATLTTVASHMPIIAKEQLAFAPGTEWSYSNSGFMLLGRIVEVASGEDYYSYVQKHIFAPAGMTHTGFYDEKGRADHVAIGYMMAAGADARFDPAGPFRGNSETREIRGGPAGGGYSTVGDLLRFKQALLAHKLLGPAMTQQILTPFARTDFPERSSAEPPPPGAQRRPLGPGTMTRGIDLAPQGEHAAFGHSGGAPGISADFRVLRDADVTVAIFGNFDPPVLFAVEDRMWDVITPIDLAPYRALPESVLRDYVGTYGPRRVSVEDGILQWQREDLPQRRLRPSGERDYFDHPGIPGNKHIHFLRDASGSVIAVEVRQGDGRVDRSDRVR